LLPFSDVRAADSCHHHTFCIILSPIFSKPIEILAHGSNTQNPIGGASGYTEHDVFQGASSAAPPCRGHMQACMERSVRAKLYAAPGHSDGHRESARGYLKPECVAHRRSPATIATRDRKSSQRRAAGSTTAGPVCCVFSEGGRKGGTAFPRIGCPPIHGE
jgi:hypothetical protein